MKSWIAVLGVLFLAAPSFAWWPKGHGVLSEAAVRSLPIQTPRFFRDGGKAVAHYSFEPDVAKNRAAPHATNAEYSEHYIDWELLEAPLQKRAFPATRYEYLKFCADNGMAPEKVGLLPFAVAEWTERLAIDFAQHRHWPNNRLIQNKCLVTAGVLAHYAQDLCQPLHVTIHHNGRADAAGTSPRSGIHMQVDALIEAFAFSPQALARNQSIEPIKVLMPEILAQIQNSRSHIDSVYELEPKLPAAEGKLIHKDPEVRAFAEERARESTRFTARLFLTAWRKSADITLPDWLQRSSR